MQTRDPYDLFSSSDNSVATAVTPSKHFPALVPTRFGCPYPPSSKKPTLEVKIRWLIRRDMPEVLDIERQSFEFAWSEEDFLCCLRQRNCIGMVAEYNHREVGFIIYELHKLELHMLNFAVDPEFRRQSVGAQMVEILVDKLTQQRRQKITIEVRETNLAAQLFFKKQGFKAVLVLRGHYDDTTESAYLMRYTLEEESAVFLPADLTNASHEGGPFVPVNRITKYDMA